MLHADPRDTTTFLAPITAAQVPVVLEDEFGTESDLTGATIVVRSTTAGATATASVVTDDATSAEYVLVELGSLPDDGPVYVGLTLVPAGDGDPTQVAPFAIVVEGDTGFHTLSSIRERWADAPKSDVYLWELLDLAREACLAYAPLKTERVPSGHRAAQMNLCRAAAMRLSGEVEEAVGLEGQGVRIYIDDADTRKLLRPRRARGGIA